jgi:Asp-tRNA(Asn)/Glu-tRNA(Gln) amidotransferase A subunit family amidase
VDRAVRDAVRNFEPAGHTVEEIFLNLETDGPRLRETIEKALFSTALGANLIELDSRKNELTSYGRRFVDLAATLGPRDAKEAADETLRFYGIIEAAVFAKGFDALISPTVATTRVPAAFDPTKDVIRIADRAVDPYSGWFLTSVFSLLNWMPVINAPAGFTANGVPCGFQITTRPYEDALAYEIASDYADRAELLPFAERGRA